VPELTRSFVIENELGLHARPATLFVKTVKPFGAEVRLSKEDGTCVNGKSVMELLILGAEKGERLHVYTKGQDAEACMEAVCDLFTNRLTEG